MSDLDQTMLGTVSFPAAEVRPTGEAGRPVKRASHTSLLDLRADGLPIRPAFFGGDKVKRAAWEAAARLKPAPVWPLWKTGAGLPARAAFYSDDAGVSIWP